MGNKSHEPNCKKEKTEARCDAIHSIILFVFNDETSNVKGVKRESETF